MLPYSSFGTSCILLVLTLLGTTFGNSTNVESYDAELIHAELLSSFAQSKIVLMGVLDQNLLIITKDSPPKVYEVPMTKYVNSQINVNEMVPVELKNKWPVLNSNENFTKHMSSEMKSFPIVTDQESLIFVFDSNSTGFLQTVNFTFKPPSASYQVIKIDDKEFFLSHAHFISSDEPNVFFNLKIMTYGTIYLLHKYPFNKSDGIKPEWKYLMCKSPNGNDSIGEVVFSPFNPSSQCSSIDWKIENGGFVYQNRFHLFAKDQVYIFEYARPSSGNSSRVPYKVVKLTDFFTIPAKNVLTISIIVVVVVFIMLVTCAVAIFLFFYISPPQNQRYKVSVSYEKDQKSASSPKKTLNVSVSTAGSTNPKDIDTSGNVSTGDAKLDNIASSSRPAKQAK